MEDRIREEERREEEEDSPFEGPSTDVQSSAGRFIIRAGVMTALSVLAFSLLLWVLGALTERWKPSVISRRMVSTILFLVVANGLVCIYLAWRENRTAAAALRALGPLGPGPPKCLACRPRVMKPVVKKLLQLLVFEIFIINIGMVIWVGGGTSFGELTLGYSFELAFFIAFAGLLGYYTIFLRFYVRRRPILLWRWYDFVLVMSPISLMIVFFFIFLIGGFLAFWLGTGMLPVVGATTWTILSLAVLFVIAMPTTLWWFVVRPRQASARHWGPGREPHSSSVMRAAIRSRCEGRRIDRATVDDLVLANFRIDVVDGLGTLTHLKRLSLEGNELVSLRGIEVLDVLNELNVRRNRLASYEALLPLRQLHRLSHVSLASNPLLLSLQKVIALVPQVLVIDDHTVTKAERRDAVQTHESWPVHVLAERSRHLWGALTVSAHVVEDLRSALICRQQGDVLKPMWGRAFSSFQPWDGCDETLIERIEDGRILRVGRRGESFVKYVNNL